MAARAMAADKDELLRDLIVRWHANDDIAASDVMRSLVGVSQTTAFRRVMSLRDQGIVAEAAGVIEQTRR